MSRGVLEGLSIVELGRMVAGPYCGKLLADLGADVLKLEQPRVGDPSRRQGPFPDDVPHPERSALFLYLNTNKRSVTLAPGSEAGRRIFEQLVGAAPPTEPPPHRHLDHALRRDGTLPRLQEPPH